MTEELNSEIVEDSLFEEALFAEEETEQVEEQEEDNVEVKTEAEDSEGQEEPTDEEPEEQSEGDILKEALANEEKRRKDTQSDNTRMRMLLKKVTEKVEAGEALDAEELAALQNSSLDDMVKDDNPYVTIAQEVKEQLDGSRKLLEATYPNLDDLVDGFDVVFQNSPDVQKELLEIPKDERLLYILNKGGEASGLVADIREHGSIDKVYAAQKEDIKSKDVAIEKLEAELAELKTSKGKTRPRINGAAPTAKASDDDSDLNILNSMGI